MGVHSGKLAVLNGFSTVRNWNINDIITNPKYVASNTLNGAGRGVGIQDWNGSFGFYGAVPSVWPGETFAFLGYTAPGDDIEGSNGQRGSGNAIIDNVAITWNWQNGEIISSVANFSGNGALAWADGAALTDATAPDVPSVCGTKIQASIPDGSAFADIANVSQAVLTISAANLAYSNASTACWMARKAGTIDWTLALTIEDDIFIGKGLDKQIKCFISATEFYLLKWGKMKDISGITANRESGEIIKHTATFEMNGFVDGVAGQIVLPDLSVWWPTP